ncbi:hypothetical protein [Deefgea piscis]|uniref:hypothetical protein n=1 Tax=Deefgea piscis TaxID=2739061 RepID=UPI001C7EB411|nr:hypothetical protein [Deefgea piscis]QZA80676.1 hypothetical protein K4H25_14390 [Deefgea piscis]
MLSRPMQYLLGATLAITAYTFWQERTEPQLDSTAKPAARRALAAEIRGASMPSTAASQASATASGASIADLFPKQSWVPPPPPPTKPPPPTPTPIPVAPPLPFVVTATWLEKNSLYVVVEGQGQSIVLCSQCDTLGRVQPGESLLGNYRLDKMSSTMLTFTFLPLNQQQTLPTGGTL